MRHAASYAVALAVFLALDLVWIATVAGPYFAERIGPLLLEAARLEVAAVFYLFYVAGVLHLAVLPARSWRRAGADGAVVGFLAYGAYDATNLATLKGWTWGMLALDVGWGTALTAATALAGYATHRRLGGGR